MAGGAGDGAAGDAIGELLDDEAAQRRRQLREAVELDRSARRAVRAIELGGDQLVQYLRLVAQQLRGAQHVLRRRGMDLSQRPDEAVADAVARVGRLDIGRIVAPSEPPLFAVGRRLLASKGE